jgi:hypothetical protein
MKCIIENVLATIVSCDIVAHGLEPNHSRQVLIIKELNDAVRISLDKLNEDAVVWASGGDGGHVAFLTDDGIIEAIALIRRLKNWADEQSVQLRLTAHTGLVSAIEGPTGVRNSLVMGSTCVEALSILDFHKPL